MRSPLACRKTDLGGGDYYLRNSGLPPSSGSTFIPPGFIYSEKRADKTPAVLGLRVVECRNSFPPFFSSISFTWINSSSFFLVE